MNDMPSLMVIGTDTGVGKTVVTAYLTKKYQQAGVNCIPFKPIASGCSVVNSQKIWADIAILAKAANCPEDDVSLYKLKKPLSPHLAADFDGIAIDLQKITNRFKELQNKYRAVIVEGTGGLMVPLNNKQTYLDLVRLLNIPVVVVTHSNLGTINHTLLTVNILKQNGISIVGLIINRFPENPDEAQENNPKELEKLTDLPILEIIPESNVREGKYRAIEADKKYVWHPFTPMDEYLAEEPHPLMIAEAKDCYLIDSNGRKYLDGVSSLWVNVHGHRKKELDDAVKAQLDKVAHSTLLGLASEPSALLAEKLVEITPRGLTKVFYSDSGSTAVEIALKVAFQYFKQIGQQEKSEFVCFSNAYHGDTIGSVSVGGIDLFHSIFKKLLFKSHQVPIEPLDRLEKLLQERNDKIAAVVIEPLVQGAAGINTQQPGNLKKIEQLCKKNDVLLIVDEVATGFGRTGKMFACEHENIKPDIMALAKGITGGYLPLAATLFTEEIYQAFLGLPEENKTFFHGHTYTGNPIACAVALANIKLLQEDNFLVEVQEKAQYLAKLLKTLKHLTHVGDVRQCGFMAGIQLVANKESGQHFPVNQRVGRKVILKAREKGVIIRPLGDVIVLMPPLAINKEELKQLVEATGWAIQEVTREVSVASLSVL